MEKIQDNTGKLYNSLKANGFNDIGTEEVFRGKLKEEGARKELYDALSKNGFNDIGNFDVFNSKIGEDYKVKDSGEEKGFWDSYTGDLVERVGAGAARLQGGGLNLLEKASRYYNPTTSINKGQPNKFQQFLMKDVIAPIFYDEAERKKLEASPIMNYNHVPTAGKELKSYADTLSSRSDRYDGKDFMELWKDNKTSAIGELFLTASESLPQGVMAAAGGAVSLPVIGAIAASDKYDKLSQDEETGDMSESAKLINSVLTGTGEALSEVGSVYIGKWLKPLYGKLGKQAAEEVAKNGFSRWMSGMFKKSGVLFAPVEEGIEEMASQLAENATDYITGATNELNLWDGVPESFAYGAAGGAQFSAAALPGLARRKIQRRKVNSEYKKSKSALESNFPDSDIAAFEDGMSTMNPDEQAEILRGIVENLNVQKEQKAAVADFVLKMNKRQLYNSPEAKAEDSIYGMFDSKMNKKSGDIVTAKDLDEKPVYVLDETEKGSLVEYENGEKKLIATSALQDINSEPVDEHVKKYFLNTFVQGDAKVKDNPIPKIDVGGDMLYDGNKARVQRLEDGMAIVEVDGTDGVRIEKVPVSKLGQVQKPEAIQPDDDGLMDINKDVENVTEQPQSPISYEIEKDIIATQQPDGAFSINKEFTKADIEKGQKFVDRMNKDYEDEGMLFELAELPKVNPDNRFEKKRFGVVARDRVQESPEQVQKPENIQLQESEDIQPEFSNEEEAVNWVSENSENVGEILGTLNAVRQTKNPQASLQEWQRQLIGRKVKIDSYNQFGDRNNVTPTMKMKWFNKDGWSLDVLAKDLSQHGREVTEQDVVDFITSNPSNRAGNTTEEIESLERRFSDVATKVSGMKIGRPDSPTGKLFIENIKNKESSEQLRQRIEDAQRAESEVLKSMAEQHEVEGRKQEDVQQNTTSDNSDTEITEESQEFDEVSDDESTMVNETYSDTGEIDEDGVRFREQNDTFTNQTFNEDLQQQLAGTLPKGHIYQLGNPSSVLLSAGIPNLPIELSAERLMMKAGQKNHPFDLRNVTNLPDAIQNPIAVFDSKTQLDSKVILTELSNGEKNFVVAIKAQRHRVSGRSILHVNEIRSLYPKDTQQLIKWIEQGDLLKWIDKEKATDWLGKQQFNSADVAIPNDSFNWVTQQRSNFAEVSIPNKDFDVATNIIQNFKNPTILEGEISSTIDALSNELGVKVNKVKDRKDLPDGIQRKMLNARYPGLYNTKTGKVYVVLNEITDTGDAQATVLHEVLGHKGIRGLFGDKLSDFTDKVLASMKDADREKLISDYDGNRQLAAEEYIASFAEGYTDPSGWEKVKAIVKELFRGMGISLDISDNDLKYILWKAKNGLREGDGIIDVAKKITEDNQMQDVLFRKPSPLQTAEEFIQEKQNFLAKAKERFLDSAISVKKLSDYLKEQGVNIRDFEDAYTEALLSDSKSFHAMNRYREKYQQPLNEAIAALNKKGKSFLDIYHYLIAKHAIERNREMGKREYEKWLDSKHREALIEKQKYDFFKKNGKKDDAEYAKKLKSFEENIASNEQKFEEERKEKQASFHQEVYAGMTDSEAADIVKTFETDCTKDEIDGLWQKINATTKFTLERQRIDGLISKELFDKLNGMYEYYVPLKGWEESDGVDYSTSERFHRPLNVSKLMKAKGRKSRADNPLAYIEMAAERAIVEGNRNYVRQCLYNMCVNNPNKKLYTVNRTYYVNRDDEWIAQVEKPDKEMFENGIAKTVLIDKPYKAAVSDANAQRYDVNVLVNGEKCTITFAQGERGLDIADAINRARMVSLDDKVSKWFGRFTRFLSAQNTSRNPEFILRNFERDFLYAVPAYAIKGGNSIKLMANMRPAFKALHNEVMKGGKKEDTELNRYMDEFLNSGGKTGFVHSLDIESRKQKTERDIRRIIRNKKSIGGAARATGHAIGATMEYLSDMSENSIRFAVFLTERQAGRNVKEAAIAAKEITVNFNRKGTLTPAMSQYYSFFNASMQGSIHNFLGLGIKWTNRFLAANAALGGIQMIAAQLSRAFGDDDEMGVSDYDRLSDFTRNNNIILPDILRLGKYFGTDNEEARQYGFMTIPMPQSFRAFSAVGIITDQVLRGRKSASDGVLEIVDNILANMSPLDLETYTLSEGQPGIFVARALPTALQPFVDIVANKNFMDRRIYNEPFSKNLEGMTPQNSLGLKNTNPLFVSASKLLNKIANGTTNINPEIQIDSDTGKVSRNKLMGYMDVNPAKVEHVVEGIAGGVGKFANNIFKTINSFITQEKLDNRDIPFVRTHRTMPYRQTHWEMYFAAREMVNDVNFAASAFKKIKNFDMYLRILMNGDQLRNGISFTVIETLVNDCDRVLMDLSTTEEGKKEWQKITDKRVLEWAKGQKQMYDEAIKKEDDKKKRIK